MEFYEHIFQAVEQPVFREVPFLKGIDLQNRFWVIYHLGAEVFMEGKADIDFNEMIRSTHCHVTGSKRNYPYNGTKLKAIKLSGIRESEVSWQPVTQSDLLPYASMGKLIVQYAGNGSHHYGSGFLIGPNHVLTASHVLYHVEDDEHPEHISFIPAKAVIPGQETDRFAVARSYTHLFYVEDRQGFYGLDIGLAVLDRPVENASFLPFGMPYTYRAILGNLATVCGFPVEIHEPKGEKKGKSIGYSMYTSSNKISHLINRQHELRLNVKTKGGHSGGPVWLEDPGMNLPNLVVAIHNRPHNLQGTIASTFNLDLLCELAAIVNSTII